MSLADALGPQLSENVPFNNPYFIRDAEQPDQVDRDEEMDDLFDEGAVVDQIERYRQYFTSCSILHPIHRGCVGTLS